MRVARATSRFVSVAAVISTMAAAPPVFAQAVAAVEPQTRSEPQQTTLESRTVGSTSLREASRRRPLESASGEATVTAEAAEKPDRPAALLPLYTSLVALQGMDIHSTRRALDAGSGQEANPAMREVVHNGAAFLAVKAGATAGVIWASEKMWKKNRKGAVIFAALVNGAMAAIVANNYRIGRQARR